MTGTIIKSNLSPFVFVLFILLFKNTIGAQTTIVTIGDSTMSNKKDADKNPEHGWAQVLEKHLPKGYSVDNHAVNGRSTKSFIDEGKWEVAKSKLKNNDLIIIQFGHNDQKINDPKRYTNPFTSYRNNLIKYVQESRALGAIPILATSIVRRKFNDHGTLVDTHGNYPLVVRMVANELNVPLIDLQFLTEKLENSYGVKESKSLHLHFEAGEHEYYPEGKKDNTHLSKKGAEEVAKLVVAELRKLNLLSQDYTMNQQSIEKIISSIQLPSIPNYEVSLIEFGGQNNGQSDNKFSFDKAISHLNEKGGGKLVVPSGKYLVRGPIHLESNINLHISKGAQIIFDADPAAYLPIVATSWEGTFINNYSPLIYANAKNNIAITGKGSINGNGDKVWATWKAKEAESKGLTRNMNHNGTPIEDRNFGEGHYLRPHLLQLKDCKNILIQDVHFENSPFWCTHFLRSSSITIRGISFFAHNKNNDGIDLEYARNVLIEDVDFDNADDNIAIKAGRDFEGRSNSATPSENIVVRNCRIKGLHAFVIGSEMAAGVRHVFIENCQASGYLKRGIYFKTNSDRGGYIQDIHIDNIVLDDTEDCIFMTANYHGEGGGKYVSKLSDIHISNIECKSASGTGIVVEGYSTKKASDIYFNNIRIHQAQNGITLINTKGIQMDEVVIGKQAGTPSSAK